MKLLGYDMFFHAENVLTCTYHLQMNVQLEIHEI